MASPVETEGGEGRRTSISTGNAEIDKKIGGGIPSGSLTLIEGQSDAGKSVLAQHLCWGALLSRTRVSYYTTENTVRSLLRQMESLGLDLTDFLLLGYLNVYPAELPADYDASQALDELLEHCHRYDNSDVIIVDSLTSLLTRSPEERWLEFFVQAKRLADAGRTFIVVVHSYAFEERTLVRVRSVCDAHLHLRIEQMGEQLVKVLEVAKVRGAERQTGNVVSFDVEPGLGMRLIPVTKAKA